MDILSEVFTFNFYNPLDCIGLLWLIVTAHLLVQHRSTLIHNTWIRQYFDRKTDLQKLGRWAAVAGATNKIGMAYCEALARRGINLVLISESPGDLRRIAVRLMSKHHVRVRCVAVDFSDGPIIFPGIIERSVEGLDVGILVNSMEARLPNPEQQIFFDVPEGRNLYKRKIISHIHSVPLLATLFLPAMSNRGRGVIIHVRSVTPVWDAQLMMLYAASRRFLDNFQQNLVEECAEQGIVFQSLVPAQVEGIVGGRIANRFVDTPEEIVERSIRMLGMERESVKEFFYRVFRGVWHKIKHGLMRRTGVLNETPAGAE